ncbi:MAG: GC-type dockerin domain-anchored protein [Phycisphaerales bacterium JB060]
MRVTQGTGHGRRAALLVVAGLPMAAPLGIALGLAPSALAQGPLTEPFPAVLELADLDGGLGFRIDGAAENDRSGRSIASAGDVNGDGIDDLIIGAPGFDAGGIEGTGAAFVVFGSAEPRDPAFDLQSIDGTNGFRLDGVSETGLVGSSVSAAGDVNGDGIDDLIVGALGIDRGTFFQTGAAYVVFGRTGGFPATLSVADLDGTNGLRLDGTRNGERASVVAGVGDLNGDGVDDLAIGAYGYQSAYDRGRTYVVYGRDIAGGADPFPAVLPLDRVRGGLGFWIDGESDGDLSGFSVDRIGDVNGDGLGDLGIGSPRATPAGRTLAGAAYVVFGRDGLSPFPDVIDLADLDGTAGFRAEGVAFGDDCGWDLAAAGDVNADGVDDLAIGAVNGRDSDGRVQTGAAYVVFGRDSGGFPASLPLSTLDGTNGFRLGGIERDDGAGVSVAGAGDANGDGIDDVIIGAVDADPGGRANAGEAYLVFGRGTPFPASIELASLDGSTGVTIPGLVERDRFGRSAAIADLNADGRADVVVSAEFADPLGRADAASNFVIFGRGGGCPADLDADGELTIFDFLAFQNLFDAGDPIADFDGDGDLTIFDFLAFQNAFDAGC